jgi:hypothetical protein
MELSTSRSKNDSEDESVLTWIQNEDVLTHQDGIQIG